MKLVEILDAIKAEYGIQSNGELARFLGTDVRRIGEYYSGKRTPIDEDYPRIAEKAHMTAGELWEAVQIEKKKDSEAARVWENYMKRLGGLAASITFGFSVLVTLHMQEGYSAPEKSESYAYANGNNTNYASFVAWVRGLVETARNAVKMHFRHVYS